MKLLKNRAAALGAAGALAAGTVLSAGVLSPASAAESSYSCQASSPFDVPVSADNPFAASYPVGSEVPAVPVTMNAELSSTLLGLISLLLPPGTTSIFGTITDAAMTVGGQSVALNDMAAPDTEIDPSGTTLPVTGETSPFTALPGSKQVKLPQTMTFTPLGMESLAFPCTLTGPAVIGTIDNAKQGSTTKARLKNAPLTKSKRGKLAVTVAGDVVTPSGKVIVKEGKKTLAKGALNDSGKKTFRLPKLSKGKHTLKVLYKGDSATAKSTKKLAFKVRRR